MPTLIHDISSPLEAVLILIPHDWAAGCSITSRIGAKVTTARTGLESRASGHFLPRHDARLKYTMSAAEAVELRTRLLTLAGQRLAIPLWIDDAPNAAGWDDFKIFDGPLLTYDGTAGTYTIGGDDEARICSLLYCKMRGDPVVTPLSGTESTIEFEVFEDCPDAQALAYNVVSGESAAIPTEADWSGGLEERFVSQVQHEDIGAGRETVTTGTEATVRRQQRGQFFLTRSEARKLLRFWLSKRGPWDSFTMGVWYEPGDPTNATFRFLDDSLTIEWASGAVGIARVEFIEEVDTVEGVPDQNGPSPAHLIKAQWRGSSNIMAWTDWESELTFDSQDYEPKPVAIQNFVQTLSTKGDSIEIVASLFSGNPFIAFALLEFERQLDITVFRCDPESPEDATQIFAGTVAKVTPKGGKLVAFCDLLGGALLRKIPGFQIRRKCNYNVYSTLCGVDPGDFEVTGTLGTQSGAVVDVTCSATDAADYFAKGKAMFGTGDTAERRHILRSEPITGGQRLTLHRPLRQTGAIAVTFYPGCSGERGPGGCEKFSNEDNFGGHWRQPSFIESVPTGFKQKVGK